MQRERAQSPDLFINIFHAQDSQVMIDMIRRIIKQIKDIIFIVINMDNCSVQQ